MDPNTPAKKRSRTSSNKVPKQTSNKRPRKCTHPKPAFRNDQLIDSSFLARSIDESGNVYYPIGSNNGFYDQRIDQLLAEHGITRNSPNYFSVGTQIYFVINLGYKVSIINYEDV